MIDVAVVRDVSGGVNLTNASITNVVAFVCSKERIKNAELSFVFVNDRKIRTINKNFLRHDYVTDVITFPLEEKNISAEIYINVQQAVRQAQQYDVSTKNELIRLIVHGTLHALGYDDTGKKERAAMLAKQERYVADLS